MRLDKFLSDMGFGTRSYLKQMIRQKHVCVNQKVVVDAGYQVDENHDVVTFQDEVITYQKYVYFMLNKPAGVISATQSNQMTVLDLIHEPYKDLFPCGRLDKDTQGLLLITNDGPLAHDLLSPKKHVEKEYYVETLKPIDENTIQKIAQGIVIDQGEQCLPAQLIHMQDNHCHIILHEGKYHQIKRMFLACDNEVTFLKRIRMKNLVLDENLKPGEYRYLTGQEIADLQNNLG